MPYEPYVSVTLRKDVVEQLNQLDSAAEKSTSAKVTDAIKEYVVTRTTKPTKVTKVVRYANISGTRTVRVNQQL